MKEQICSRLSPRQIKEYKNPDNDPRGPWVSRDYSAQGYRPNQMYKIVTPAGVEHYPPEGCCWKNVEDVYLNLFKEGRFWFGENGKGVPRRKNYLSEAKGKQSWTWWPNDEVGHSQEAKQEIVEILEGQEAFDTPKPSRLIQRMLWIATNPGGLVLDSFAGSGTTAHAVMALNKEDGGSRKFILVECEDYVDTVTAERVRRVIQGVPSARDQSLRAGLGGSFTYCTLGQPIDVEGLLTGAALPDYGALTAYLLHTATGISSGAVDLARQNEDGLFYSDDRTDYYLLYEPDTEWLRSSEGVLGEERVKRIGSLNATEGRLAVVFAVGKDVGQRELTRQGITFCQLPYELHRGG